MNELLFHNARIFTIDRGRPRAEALAARDGQIVAAGGEAEAAATLDAGYERIDCQGGDLLPAFIDAHCHVLAYAASLRSVDCTAARSIADIRRAVGARAKETPEGRWVRAFGYEETSLADGRHPDRHDLDAAAPDRPVRLIHRSGHASVLNSLALRLAGIDITTEEAPGGAIERDPTSGEPAGLLVGMERRIEQAVAPLPQAEFADGVREAARRFLAAGITCVQDATHTNGRHEWDLFERLAAEGALPLDVVLMEGIDHLGELPEQDEAGRLRRGAVKIMVDELEGRFAPNERELARQVWEVHASGRQVAIHAVGEQAVEAAAASIEQAVRRRPRGDHRHRIEHCGVLPDGLASKLAELGIVVVSQPSFVYERGDRYRRLVPEEQRGGLYSFRTLRDAGVALAAGSDAPVTAPTPLASIAAAVDRRTAAGGVLGSEQAVAAADALAWWTAGASHASFLEAERGSLRPGRRADLVLLPAGAVSLAACELRQVVVRRLWRAGREVALDSPARS